MVTTRNRASKADQSDNNSNKAPPKANADQGTKRKRASSTDQGDTADIENEPDKSRLRLQVDEERQEQGEHILQQSALVEPVVCSCRQNVMKCIGILPSLPIMNQYYDSDESESDLEEYSHTVLPIVDRNSNKQQGTES